MNEASKEVYEEKENRLLSRVVKIFRDVGLDWLAVFVGSGCRWISWIPLRRALAVSTGA
jgi:hypothetical protein